MLEKLELMGLLNRLEEMEGGLGEMYIELRKAHLNDTGLAGLFYRMSNDHFSHRDVIRYEKRLYRKARNEFKAVEIDTQQIDDVNERIAFVLEKRLDIKDAVNACLNIENSPAVVYFVTAMQQSNQNIAMLLGNIGDSFMEHYKDILQSAHDLGIVIKSDSAASLAELGMEHPYAKMAPQTETAARAAGQDEAAPVMVDEQPAAADAGGDAVAGNLGDKTEPTSILVAEDDPLTMKMIVEILDSNGYIVTKAEDGIKAMKQLTTNSFDLVLSDVVMPNMDGFKLMEFLKQQQIETPIIFLTSLESHEDERRAKALGVLDYIRKPVNKEVLLFSVKAVLLDTFYA